MSGMGFSWVYSRAVQKHNTPSQSTRDAAPFPKGGKPSEAVNESRLGGFHSAHQGEQAPQHNAAPFPKGGKPSVIVNESRLGGFTEPNPGNHNSQAMRAAAPFSKGGKPSEVVNESRLGGFLVLQQERLQYRPNLKQKARALRTHMTEAEQFLWFYLRRKQMDGVQFFRQRPAGEVILDFYAPSIRLAIEVDGGQRFDAARMEADKRRTASLDKFGIAVIRFDNLQVLKETGVVLEEIHRVINDRKSPSIPL